MEKKASKFKSFSGQVIIGVMGTLISAFIVAKSNGFFESKGPDKEARNEKIIATLEAYSNDINKKNFDAYKYFTPKIERFYQMFDASPKK